MAALETHPEIGDRSYNTSRPSPSSFPTVPGFQARTRLLPPFPFFYRIDYCVDLTLPSFLHSRSHCPGSGPCNSFLCSLLPLSVSPSRAHVFIHWSTQYGLRSTPCQMVLNTTNGEQDNVSPFFPKLLSGGLILRASQDWVMPWSPPSI